MREIKLRAWDTKKERFDYYPLISNGSAYHVDSLGNLIQYSEGRIILQQYTGLKDKNGKDIYEGDVLDGSYTNPMSGEVLTRHYLVAIEKGNSYAQLIGHHPYGTTLLYFENEKGVVIGNIYEHSYLIGR